MEHRQARREMVNITVLLNTPDGVTRHGCITDLSNLGASINMIGGTAVRGSTLEVKLLPLHDAHQSRKFRARGYVVWAQDNRFGLLWIKGDAVSLLLDQALSRQPVSSTDALTA